MMAQSRPAFGAGMLAFLLFSVSGCSGLIYQSIWSQYLGLFLGHAAYAQSLVLAIFMGGLAVGVASDEVERRGVNEQKRALLIAAGADAIIPDFSQPAALLDYLFTPG